MCPLSANGGSWNCVSRVDVFCVSISTNSNVKKSLFYDHEIRYLIFNHTLVELIPYSFVKYSFSFNGKNLRFVMYID